jgi:2-C-methyl-D-erythritol 2,4-cyclodiphosphate synthase
MSSDRASSGDVPSDTGSTYPFRIGHGFDVHPWSDDPKRALVLGGVRFADQPGLAGHSDADVVAHACIDAVLGAAGLGDIGGLFPDTDPTLAGADSLSLLEIAVGRAHDAGWDVVNIDCTLVLDVPRLAPHRDAMQRNLAEAVGAVVTIKGKRTEGLEGLQGGVQGHAVALLAWRGTLNP